MIKDSEFYVLPAGPGKTMEDSPGKESARMGESLGMKDGTPEMAMSENPKGFSDNNRGPSRAIATAPPVSESPGREQTPAENKKYEPCICGREHFFVLKNNDVIWHEIRSEGNERSETLAAVLALLDAKITVFKAESEYCMSQYGSPNPGSNGANYWLGRSFSLDWVIDVLRELRKEIEKVG